MNLHPLLKMARILDIIFFIYFVIHIPIALVIDSQSIMPSNFFPKQLIDLKMWYCNTFRDVLLREAPLWMQSFIYCEMIFQVPFFFLAAYGYFKGAEKCKWLRIPAIIYGSHAATTVFTSMIYVLLQDFSQAQYPAPRNREERLTLVSMYSSFFIIPLAIVLDAALSPVYLTSNVKNPNPPKNQKNRSRRKKAA